MRRTSVDSVAEMTFPRAFLMIDSHRGIRTIGGTVGTYACGKHFHLNEKSTDNKKVKQYR